MRNIEKIAEILFCSCFGLGVAQIFCLKNLSNCERTTNELQHDKTNKMTCAPSEDLDQPGHPPSLIRVFAVCMKKPLVLNTHCVHSED